MTHESLGQAGEDPEYITETLTGPQFEELAFGLLTHTTNVITVDGQRMVNINGRTFNRDTDTVTLTCRDDTGRRHVFAYQLEPDSPVAHIVLEDDPDARA